MKKVGRKIGVIVGVLLIGMLLANLVTKYIIQKQLTKTFEGSEVSISNSRWSFVQQLHVYDIRINKASVYDIYVQNASAYFDIESLWHKKIFKVSLQNVVVDLTLPKFSVFDYQSEKDNNSDNTYTVENILLSDMRLNIKVNDLALKANGSMHLNMDQKYIDFMDMNFEQVQSRKLQFEQGEISARHGNSDGKIIVQKIKYDDMTLENLKGIVSLDKTDVQVNNLQGELFSGIISGKADLDARKGLEFITHLKFHNLDIEQLVTALELEKKFQMTGLLGGHLTLQGKGSMLNIISGDFSMSESGGALIIKDTRFLESMAKRINQPVDLLVESFKNYHYNNGEVGLSLQENNLIMDMNLDGATGKRDLTITLHELTK